MVDPEVVESIAVVVALAGISADGTVFVEAAMILASFVDALVHGPIERARLEARVTRPEDLFSAAGPTEGARLKALPADLSSVVERAEEARLGARLADLGLVLGAADGARLEARLFLVVVLDFVIRPVETVRLEARLGWTSDWDLEGPVEAARLEARFVSAARLHPVFPPVDSARFGEIMGAS